MCGSNAPPPSPTASRLAGSKAKRDAIVAACQRILDGEYLDQFVVDRFQAGAGTSHNMNSNEVIANLANVALGGEKGAYKPVNPNDHVNMGQSTNDTIPTAIRLAALAKLPRLIEAVQAMAAEFARLAEREKRHRQKRPHPFAGRRAHHARARIRRLCLDAAPLRRSTRRGTPARCARSAWAVPPPAPASTPRPTTPARVAAELARSPASRSRAADLAAQMQSMGDLQHSPREIRDLALELTRIANDLRLLASGPRTGLGEISCRRCSPARPSCPARSTR